MTRRGFTLLELVLVLAVVVMLAAIAIPSILPLYRQYRVAAAADSIKAALITARAQAVEDGQPYCLYIIPGKGNFRVAPENYTGGSNGPPAPDAAGNQPYVAEDSLPQSIVFAEGDNAPIPEDDEVTSLPSDQINSTQWKPVATLLPDGTAREDVVITLRTRGGAAMIVNLRGLTGAVTSRKPSAEGR
jgi:prepilin-type N-terminal cleavage/methylation domain-containing protein